MEEEKYQKELFEFEKPKRQLPRFGRIFPRSNFAVTLGMEKLILISIGIIICMVIIYALGIERGKRLGQTPVVQSRVIGRAPAPLVPQEKAAPIPAKAPLIQETAKPYTIVAAAFATKDKAQEEAGRLKKGSFDSFVAESAPYFLACVGAYPDKESAKPTLSKVRKTYKDAYLKLR